MQTQPDGESEELPNLAHLWVFVRVAETGSATKAAETLFRTQSTITRSVQELEQTFGTQLFERRPSGMLPTPVGRAVIQRAERVFTELLALVRWCASTVPGGRAQALGAVPPYLLNTRRLQLLVVLARDRHMPSAALALGITQPAVSSAVKVLESGAGLRLFYRSGRGLQPTAEGEIFVLHVRRALNELRHVPDDIAALRGSIRGRVTVGALPLARTSILPEAIARATRAWPGIRVVTDESAYEMLVAGLRAGDIDFILGALRPTHAASGLLSQALISEEMVVLARRDHPLAVAQTISLSELTEARWILPRNHAPARRILDALFVRQGLEPPTASVETGDLELIRGVLLRTDMIAAVSRQQLQYELELGRLTALPVRMPHTTRDIGLTIRAAGELSPAAQKLADAVRSVVIDMGRDAGVH